MKILLTLILLLAAAAVQAQGHIDVKTTVHKQEVFINDVALCLHRGCGHEQDQGQ